MMCTNEMSVPEEDLSADEDSSSDSSSSSTSSSSSSSDDSGDSSDDEDSDSSSSNTAITERQQITTNTNDDTVMDIDKIKVENEDSPEESEDSEESSDNESEVCIEEIYINDTASECEFDGDLNEDDKKTRVSKSNPTSSFITSITNTNKEELTENEKEFVTDNIENSIPGNKTQESENTNLLENDNIPKINDNVSSPIPKIDLNQIQEVKNVEHVANNANNNSIVDEDNKIELSENIEVNERLESERIDLYIETNITKESKILNNVIESTENLLNDKIICKNIENVIFEGSINLPNENDNTEDSGVNLTTHTSTQVLQAENNPFDEVEEDDYSEEYDENVGIYDDIPDFDYDKQLKELKNENEALRYQLQVLERTVNKFQDENTKLSNIKQALGRNISVLYATALAEIKFKDTTISELRRELEDIKFRRQRTFKEKTFYTETENSNQKELEENISERTDSALTIGSAKYLDKNQAPSSSARDEIQTNPIIFPNDSNRDVSSSKNTTNLSFNSKCDSSVFTDEHFKRSRPLNVFEKRLYAKFKSTSENMPDNNNACLPKVNNSKNGENNTTQLENIIETAVSGSKHSEKKNEIAVFGTKLSEKKSETAVLSSTKQSQKKRDTTVSSTKHPEKKIETVVSNIKHSFLETKNETAASRAKHSQEKNVTTASATKHLEKKGETAVSGTKRLGKKNETVLSSTKNSQKKNDTAGSGTKHLEKKSETAVSDTKHLENKNETAVSSTKNDTAVSDTKHLGKKNEIAVSGTTDPEEKNDTAVSDTIHLEKKSETAVSSISRLEKKTDPAKSYDIMPEKNNTTVNESLIKENNKKNPVDIFIRDTRISEKRTNDLLRSKGIVPLNDDKSTNIEDESSSMPDLEIVRDRKATEKMKVSNVEESSGKNPEKRKKDLKRKMFLQKRSESILDRVLERPCIETNFRIPKCDNKSDEVTTVTTVVNNEISQTIIYSPVKCNNQYQDSPLNLCKNSSELSTNHSSQFKIIHQEICSPELEEKLNKRDKFPTHRKHKEATPNNLEEERANYRTYTDRKEMFSRRDEERRRDRNRNNSPIEYNYKHRRSFHEDGKRRSSEQGKPSVENKFRRRSPDFPREEISRERRINDDNRDSLNNHRRSSGSRDKRRTKDSSPHKHRQRERSPDRYKRSNKIIADNKSRRSAGYSTKYSKSSIDDNETQNKMLKRKLTDEKLKTQRSFSKSPSPVLTAEEKTEDISRKKRKLMRTKHQLITEDLKISDDDASENEYVVIKIKKGSTPMKLQNLISKDKEDGELSD